MLKKIFLVFIVSFNSYAFYGEKFPFIIFNAGKTPKYLYYVGENNVEKMKMAFDKNEPKFLELQIGVKDIQGNDKIYSTRIDENTRKDLWISYKKFTSQRVVFANIVEKYLVNQNKFYLSLDCFEILKWEGFKPFSDEEVNIKYFRIYDLEYNRFSLRFNEKNMAKMIIKNTIIWDEGHHALKELPTGFESTYENGKIKFHMLRFREMKNEKFKDEVELSVNLEVEK